MTDLIDGTGVVGLNDLDLAPEPPRLQADAVNRSSTSDYSRPGPILLAIVLGCSAIVLFVTAATLIAGSRPLAIGLFIGAWAQLILAIAALLRPSRTLFGWTFGGNFLVVALWAATLVGHTDVGRFTPWAGLALTGSAILVSLALRSRPRLGASWSSSTSVLCSVIPVAVVVLTTFAAATSVTAPSATAHPASAKTANPSSVINSVSVPGENTSRFLQIASGNDSEKSELKPYVPLDPQTQALLTQQLATAEQAALRFPTVADAKAAGMVLAGGMAPGVGAHYQVLNASSLDGINPDGSVNPAKPASWIYASTADNAPVVGVMYESLTANPPSGFAGPNDHWHQHSNLCITFKNGMIGVPFAPDSSVTPQECTDAHGVFMKKTVWMVHAWMVPGWESPQGVFSHANLHIYCPGNTDLVDAIGFCVRQS